MKKILIILMSMFAIGIQNVSAQDGVKIVTNHPDFNIKVKRCVANGKTVVIDMVFTNNSENDVDMSIGVGNGWTIIHDDQGNEYGNGKITLKIANKEPNGWWEDFTLIAGVPTNVKWTIKDVPVSVEQIARMLFMTRCGALSLNDSKTMIRNIPISRN
jgi:hypothetical protein